MKFVDILTESEIIFNYYLMKFINLEVQSVLVFLGGLGALQLLVSLAIQLLPKNVKYCYILVTFNCFIEPV